MTTAIATPEVLTAELGLDQLQPSPNNPRRTMNEADLAEMVASIREHGIQVPLLVRPMYAIGVPVLSAEQDIRYYEIVAGHRRYAGAGRAGLDSVICIVRQLADEQAAEIALVDNVQRVVPWPKLSPTAPAKKQPAKKAAKPAAKKAAAKPAVKKAAKKAPPKKKAAKR
jgi:ParB/RepB/Spo0J family partition protein